MYLKIKIMKQTAVEWLVEQMLVCNYINKKQYDNCKSWLLQEAKEMEKEQIEKSFDEGWLQCNINELPEKSRKHFKTATDYFYFTYTQSSE